jgi:TolB-like protein
MTDAPLSFMARLKRHHIFRVASVYAIAAWVLIQVANGVFPDIGLTRADVRVVIAAVALLFPVALVLGWMFIPPSKENPVKFSSWQHLRWKLGSVLTLVIVVLVVISGMYLWRVQTRQLKAEEIAATKTSVASSAPAATSIPDKSIAVLPFSNLSGDQDNVYFSDGITEEILNALAQIPDLKVTARTSAFVFSGKHQDPRKVGETLGVANLLVGSVQKSGDQVRINVQLIDARTGYQRWSEKYDRKLSNIFAVEDEISNAIAGELKVQLTGGAGQALVAQQAIDPRAHESYLRGLSLLAARSIREAADAFQQAVKLDPDYAQAWGALAQTQVLLPQYAPDEVQAAQSRAEATAQHALVLNPDTMSAYVALGMIYTNRWQWADADKAFHRALALAPGDAEGVD